MKALPTPSNGEGRKISLEELKQALKASRNSTGHVMKTGLGEVRLTDTAEHYLRGINPDLDGEGVLTAEAVKMLLARTRQIASDHVRATKAVRERALSHGTREKETT